MASKKERVPRELVCLSGISPRLQRWEEGTAGICAGTPEGRVGTFSSPRYKGSQRSHLPWVLPEPVSAQLSSALLGRTKRENGSPSPYSFPCSRLQLGPCPLSEEKVKDRKTARLDRRNWTG